MEYSRYQELGAATPPTKATAFAQHYIKSILQAADTAVDATCGNGHDTLFLASLTGIEGKVLALDIQEQAISQTRQRLSEHQMHDRVQCLLACHSQLGELCAQHLPKRPRAIMFNFGYLPGGDKSLITQTHTSLIALRKSWEVLAPSGILSAVVYPGHTGGGSEAQAIQQWVNQQSPQRTLASQAARPDAPQALLMIK